MHLTRVSVGRPGIVLVAMGIFALGVTQERGQRPPPVVQAAGTEAEAITEIKPRTVTWNWMRMNDPQAINLIVEGKGAARGDITRALVPSYLQSRLSGARATVQRRQTASAGRLANAQVKVSAADMKGDAAKWAELFKPVEKVTASLDFGDVVLQTGGPTMRYFRGVAPANGTLQVTSKQVGSFRPVFVRTFTGNIVNGEPETESSKLLATNETGKLKLKEGQEYAVGVALYPTGLGAQSASVNFSDGSDITLNLTGKIVPKNGWITAWWGDEGFDFLAGQKYTRKLHVALDGNADTKIRVEVLSVPNGMNVGQKQVNAAGKSETVIDIPIAVSANMADTWSAPIALKVSAFDGNSSVNITADARVQTLWAVWEDYKQSAGNVKLTGTFKFNSTGYWQWNVYAETSSKITSDDFAAGVVVKRSGNDGSHPGQYVGGNLKSATQPGPSSKSGLLDGYYAPFAKDFDAHASAGINVYLAVNKESSFKAWLAKWKLTKLPQ